MRLEGIDPVQFLQQAKIIVGRIGVTEVIFSYPCRIEIMGVRPPQMFIITDKGEWQNYGAAPDYLAKDQSRATQRYLAAEFPNVKFVGIVHHSEQGQTPDVNGKPLTPEDLEGLLQRHTQNGLDTDDLGPYLGEANARDRDAALIEVTMGADTDLPGHEQSENDF